MHPYPVDKVQDNMNTKTRQRYIQSPQILETNFPTEPTPQNNGKTDRQAKKVMTKVHDRQHGFRKNKSTESAISQTVNYIEKHMANNEDVILTLTTG